MREFNWVWEPNSIIFKPQRFVHSPVYGKQIHQYSSPYWMFELTLPPIKENVRREIDAFFNVTGGVDIVSVYDPRVPLPGHHAVESSVRDITVTAMSIENNSITVIGEVGDVITRDDPVAFTHEGVRHYFRATRNLTLNGTPQDLRVALTPRLNLSGLDYVLDRVRPRCRFQVDINNTGGLTNVDGFTDYTLRGVEFFGAIL